MEASQPYRQLPQISRLQALLNSFRFSRDPIGTINDSMASRGDTYRGYIGGIYPCILTADPGFMQHVLQKNHRNYQKSPMHFDKLGHFLGQGLLTSDGEYWLRQRRLIQPGFHRDKLAALTRIMNEVIDDFLVDFDQQVKSKEEVDVFPPMLRLAFRIVAKSLFSTNIEEGSMGHLSDYITEIQEFIIKQIRQPYLEPWFKISGQLQHHERLAEEAGSIILNYIRQRRESGAREDDLMQMLLDSRYEDTGKGMTDKQLLDESMILFVAGHETSANALAWSLYLLSQHPDVVQKIRAEADRVLGDRQPDFQDLRQLEYLYQVIEESLRLYPPAWITDRLASGDDEYKGIQIRKGMILITYIYGAHHSPDSWEAPERFDPDRFHKENKGKRHPFAYMPFGGGPRLCIGNNFALMELQLALLKMVRNYDFELVPDQQIEMQALITLRPKNGIKLKVINRP